MTAEIEEIDIEIESMKSDDPPSLQERPTVERLRSGIHERTSLAPASELPVTRRSPEMRVTVALRVRLRVLGDRICVVPDDDESEGTPALLLPTQSDDDLRTLFASSLLDARDPPK